MSAGERQQEKESKKERMSSREGKGKYRENHIQVKVKIIRPYGDMEHFPKIHSNVCIIHKTLWSKKKRAIWYILIYITSVINKPGWEHKCKISKT